MFALASVSERVEPASFASRERALELLDTYAPEISQYAPTRNYAVKGKSKVSGLSAFVRYRLIQERELIAAALRGSAAEQAGAFIDQVGWRTYFKGHLEQHPLLWQRFLSSFAALNEQMDAGQRQAYGRAINGETGIDCFDCWVKELQSTGYLHNHARMWFASIWIFTLGLPWQLGARFFLQHLLDGDPASNTLSWRWVAGLHTRGKRYYARADNIRKYTDGRFTGEGVEARACDSVPDDGGAASISLDPLASSTESLFPCLSTSPAGLLVTPDDLSPEVSELGESPFGSICVLDAEDVYGGIKRSEAVVNFARAAVADAGERLAREWRAECRDIEGELAFARACASPSHVGCNSSMRVYRGHVREWVPSVVNWAKREHLKAVRLFRPPIGFYRDQMPKLRAALLTENIQVFEYRRKWDSALWPHANAGYFNFRAPFHAYLEANL